jgi:hypothetical protein
MDKKGAIERLDAVEKEAEELRKIIERSDKIKYDDRKMYVAVQRRYVYLLCGFDMSRYFRWHSFEKHIPEQGATCPSESGQEAINYMIASDGDIRVFSDPKEGMTFFYKKYLELNV